MKKIYYATLEGNFILNLKWFEWLIIKKVFKDKRIKAESSTKGRFFDIVIVDEYATIRRN